MTREEYKEAASKAIDQVGDQIDKMKAKKNEVSGQLREQYDSALKDLELKQAKMTEKYNEMKSASDDKWEEVKSTFSSASDSFREGFSKLSTLFKSQNAE